jgi:integrase/recombinase XerD
MTPIAPLIEAFLRDTLANQRGASRHTQASYASSFQLLFEFTAKKLKIRPSALTLEQLDASLVSAFLEHLEEVRKNAAVTRNVRLAAIKSFYRFLEYRQPARSTRSSAGANLFDVNRLPIGTPDRRAKGRPLSVRVLRLS